MQDPNFNPGGLRDSEDNRDHLWAEVGFGSSPFDWDTGFDIEEELKKKLAQPDFTIPPKDQNGSFSCGGQAWSYYAAVIEALATGTFEERSAKYIYSQIFIPNGGGSYGRGNSELLKNDGVCLESLLSSYENGKPPQEAYMRRAQDILESMRTNAKLTRTLSYSNVDPNIDSIAQAIRDNGGVVIGVDGANNGTWLSEYPKPPAKKEWGHWVYAGKAKKVDGKKSIFVLNSWGKEAGKNGWQILQDDYFDAGAVWQGWTMVFNPEPPTDEFKYTFKHQMDFGSFGEEVKNLQKALQISGEFLKIVPATGFYGTVTRGAVQKFQIRYGLTTVNGPGYGRVGPKTLAKLNELFS